MNTKQEKRTTLFITLSFTAIIALILIGIIYSITAEQHAGDIETDSLKINYVDDLNSQKDSLLLEIDSLCAEMNRMESFLFNDYNENFILYEQGKISFDSLQAILKIHSDISNDLQELKDNIASKEYELREIDRTIYLYDK